MTMAKRKVKFEHRKQEVLPFPAFLSRLARYGFFAFSLILVSVLAGTVGYRYFAEISWLDSFYMACMILTGMGPVAEMNSDSAKIFSALYALYSGVAFLSITAVFFAPVIHRLLHILHVEQTDDDR